MLFRSKNTVYNEELQNRINTDIQHSNFNSIEKMGEYRQKSLDLANQEAAKLYEMQLKTGISREPGESEQSYVNRLSQGAYEKDLAIAKAKSDIIAERQKAIEDQKEQNREKLLERKFQQALSKQPKGTKTVAGKVITNLTEGALDWDEQQKIGRAHV